MVIPVTFKIQFLEFVLADKLVIAKYQKSPYIIHIKKAASIKNF